MNIVVINGNPKSESLCGALAESYASSARAAGHTVEVVHTFALQFDPVLHWGHDKLPAMEPDLERLQKQLLAAQHVVFVFPDWWGGPPALFKGLLERVLLPGFAYRFVPGRKIPERLLIGRSAEVIVTMGSPAYLPWLRMRRPTWKRFQLDFLQPCGFGPVKGCMLPSAHGGNPKTKEYLEWIRRAAESFSR